MIITVVLSLSKDFLGLRLVQMKYLCGQMCLLGTVVSVAACCDLCLQHRGDESNYNPVFHLWSFASDSCCSIGGNNNIYGDFLFFFFFKAFITSQDLR